MDDIGAVARASKPKLQLPVKQTVCCLSTCLAGTSGTGGMATCYEGHEWKWGEVDVRLTCTCLGKIC
jgi:hypothetical protein